MDGPGEELLARAGFAEKQHVGLAPGGTPHLAQGPLHGRAAADDAGAAHGQGILLLFAETQRPQAGQAQRLLAGRLLDVVPRAA